MNTFDNTINPVFADFHELASESPDRAIEQLVWLFTDARLSARRHAFLTGFSAAEFATGTGIPATALAAIRRLGIFQAIQHGEVDVEMIAAAACSPRDLVEVYEAFNNERAPWLRVPMPEHGPIQTTPTRLGRKVTWTPALLGSGEIPSLSLKVPEQDVVGPSPSGRELLAQCSFDRVLDCPFGVIGVRLIVDNRVFSAMIVVSRNDRTERYEGSATIEFLTEGVRTELSDGDSYEPFRLNSVEEVKQFGITADAVNRMLENDPVARNNATVRNRLTSLLPLLAESTDEEGE